jgi:hypothetical protein
LARAGPTGETTEPIAEVFLGAARLFFRQSIEGDERETNQWPRSVEDRLDVIGFPRKWFLHALGSGLISNSFMAIAGPFPKGLPRNGAIRDYIGIEPAILMTNRVGFFPCAFGRGVVVGSG